MTHTAVTRNGFEAAVIHEWPDKVGEFINPNNVGSIVTGRSYRLPRLVEALETRTRAKLAQKTTPNQQQVEWVKQDPARRAPLFDAEFGAGAWSKAASIRGI